MKNSFITFRLPEPLAERVNVAAEAELLTVSDICRRSIVEALKGLEAKHGLGAPKPSVSTSNGLPSEWLVTQR